MRYGQDSEGGEQKPQWGEVDLASTQHTELVVTDHGRDNEYECLTGHYIDNSVE
jgi:hypothetical protein